MAPRRSFAARMSRPAPGLVVAPLALDALSAAIARDVGFEAIYLGGGGLGYQRAVTEALLTATEVAEAARAITERVEVAVVVDGGVGFGDAVHMGRAIRLVEGTGAAAIEIEDQVAPKRVHHHRGVEHLVPAEEMVGRIRAAVDARSDRDFLLVVRCNAFAHEGIERTLERASRYAEAGADLLMLLPRTDEQFAAASAGTTLPLAAMTLGPARPAADLVAAGYALAVDAASATVLGYRALRGGYEAMWHGDSFGVEPAVVREAMREIGRVIGIDALYAVEERTTEPPN